MPNKHSLKLVALALFLAPITVAAQPQPPAPATADQAKAHFQRGVELFREGDFRSALVEFRRAYDLSGNFKVLYNIGQTELQLQDYASGLRSLQRYLEGGGAEIEASRRAQVEDEIKRLAARVARVEVKADVQGAEVLVDDVVVGKTPLSEAILVSIGRRKITIQRGGAVSAARYVDLAGGDRTVVTLELAEPKALAPVAPVAPIAPAPAEPPSPPSRTGLWIGLAATGGLLVGTGITGALALSARSDAVDKLNTLGSKPSDIESARSKTKTLALAADILGGATLVMAGVTVVLGVTGGSKSQPPSTTALTVGPRSLALGGTF